jgi:MarR family transcriptional regulator, organic hydroperoxide resistance regulator
MKPSSLDDNIVYLCAQFSHHFNLLIRSEFQRHGIGITPEQLSILVFLWYRGAATQQDISVGLNRDKTTITRVLQNMIRSRIVTRAIHPEDNRARMISLTPKGKRLQDAALQVSGKLYTDMLSGVKEQELVVGTGVLQRLLRNVQRHA